MNVIEFSGISKSFPRHHRGRQFLKNYLAQRIKTRSKDRFYALQDVSFTVEQGMSLAVIGPNGAGKSTLLSLIAGISQPDCGKVKVEGRVSALLELGSGFHPDLTGAENIRINAALLGLTRQAVNERFDAIVDFSGIREFIDEPIRTYSSGMTMRLAFSVAVHVDADVMLIDEVLAVGDQAFQEKCFGRIRQMRQQGRTLVCVSHVSTMISKLCDHAIWLNTGRVVQQGPIEQVLESYSHGSTVVTRG